MCWLPQRLRSRSLARTAEFEQSQRIVVDRRRHDHFGRDSDTRQPIASGAAASSSRPARRLRRARRLTFITGLAPILIPAEAGSAPTGD
jgi:hypothetical protein